MILKEKDTRHSKHKRRGHATRWLLFCSTDNTGPCHCHLGEPSVRVTQERDKTWKDISVKTTE